MRNSLVRLGVIGISVSFTLALGACNDSTAGTSAGGEPLTGARARSIAKEAFVYGFPLVDHYRIQHSYFVDKDDPEYKGAWNQVHNTARVYTPADTAIQTPNSDTPYSQLGADLRTEPLVLTVPPVDKGRYFSLQFVDGYTYNFDYVGTRTTGNGGGRFLLAGPHWKGVAPAWIDKVLRSESELAFVLYRTQLFSPTDIDEVKRIQAGYKVEPLSSFTRKPPPVVAPRIDFLPALTADQIKVSLEFFNQLAFILQFLPALPQEGALRARFAEIGVIPGRTFDVASLSPEFRQALQAGMADGTAELERLVATKIEPGVVTSADLFGNRAAMNDNYLYRMAGAWLGIYGNDKQEALYPGFSVDADGVSLSGTNSYTVRYGPGELPPVDAFWSLTMYSLPASLLVANPIDRYLINSAMLRDLVRDPDGGYTFYVQHTSPGPAKEANWLPSPDGPFRLINRLYIPRPAALDGRWTAPKPERVR